MQQPFWAILHNPDDQQLVGSPVRDVPLLVMSVSADDKAAGWAFHDPAGPMPQIALNLGGGRGIPFPHMPLAIAGSAHDTSRRPGTWRRWDDAVTLPDPPTSLLH